MKLLVLSSGSPKTGYGRVATTLLDHLCRTYDCTLAAVDQLTPPGARLWRFWGTPAQGDLLGLAAFPQLFEELHPDVVLFIYDYYLFTAYRRLFPQLLTSHCIVYCPIDGTITHDAAFAPLAAAQAIVAFTDFSRAELANCFKRLQVRAPPLYAIPHPIETGRFFAIPRAEARRQLFCSDDDSFIVLNANRNTTRKRIDLTLRAFAEFARDKPSNVKLYLHMGMRDKGTDIAALSTELGIVDRLILSTSSLDPPHVSDEMLNLIYNACDVGINTSVGEGWGLVAFEHASTGAAQVLPANSVIPELWDRQAVLVPASEPFHHPNEPISHRAILSQHAAMALDKLYGSRAELREWSARARSRANDPTLRPEAIASRWIELIEAVCARSPAPSLQRSSSP